MNYEKYMKFALLQAQQTKEQTSPNPAVGAVLVKDGNIIGFGAHLKAGEAHAEALALQMAGSKAKNATMYVTLEPCSHRGRTGPCTDLLSQSGIKHVVVACLDPNKEVSGQGVDKLRQAGIKVDVGLLNHEAKQLNNDFFHFIENGRPYVTLKSAISLDGKTATYTGESKWITGKEARLDVHHYRHGHDAILVGVNTVLVDNPSLTTRLPHGGKNPIRIILDTTLRTPLHSKVVTDGEADTWIIVGNKVSEQDKNLYSKQKRVRIIQLQENTIQIPAILNKLGSEGIMSVFVEGGAEINGSFLESRQINQVITYIAPKVIGGHSAPTSFGGKGMPFINDIQSLCLTKVQQIGEDIKIIAQVNEEDANVHRNC